MLFVNVYVLGREPTRDGVNDSAIFSFKALQSVISKNCKLELRGK